ncbi:MAG: bifunctional 4-hydroxy-2-oxoglutarate aldolase/2-dehydro-3-deoxy-phosphogluconate aldolase [Betaproteobacteria bacterium]|nr:bifunctional 4-hydroxy-2-oxoglutarate aldolase/2-dehydro-3-deoxy-phosphogluconate aldolase [Betaproteobacteria bacterium]
MAVNAAPSLDEVMQDGPVIPVVVVDDVVQAVGLAHALVRGGVRVIELTLRTPVAFDAIAAIRREVPEAWVGAGTVLHADDVQRAQQAGALFAVSPGFTPALHAACTQWALPWLPGVATASEVMHALDAGLTRLKFFPAVPAGGVPLLRAWAGPLPQARFCPTGGIDVGNAAQFLQLPNVACVGGSWLTPPALLKAHDWPAITALAQQARALRGAA